VAWKTQTARFCEPVLQVCRGWLSPSHCVLGGWGTLGDQGALGVGIKFMETAAAGGLAPLHVQLLQERASGLQLNLLALIT
jgi:hypothetical protein